VRENVRKPGVGEAAQIEVKLSVSKVTANTVPFFLSRPGWEKRLSFEFSVKVYKFAWRLLRVKLIT